MYPWWTVIALLRLDCRKSYGIGLTQKLSLVRKIRRNCRRPGIASVFWEHIQIATRLLQVPVEMEGMVAEFGCYKGLSSANLSLVCALTRRRLVVFDSFEGLPEPTETIRHLSGGDVVPYEQGDFCGTLDEVRQNVQRYGVLNVCEFVKGYFDETLPNLDVNKKFVLIFEDADLTDSVRTVLRNAWHKLQPNCTFFCHEARDREVVDIFFDKTWWADHIGEPAPGFIGSGCGMMTGPTDQWCSLGFTIRQECRAVSSSM
jgi:hypothetical protein